MAYRFKIGTKNKVDNSQYVPITSKFSLPTAPKKHRINWVNIIICIASILFLTIMVLTKLCPCIKTTWTQDFCNRWNEFWFSFSASFIAAILFYVIFSLIPIKAKREEIESLIKNDLNSLLSHFNFMLISIYEIEITSFEIKDESFIDYIITKDWKNVLYRYPYLHINKKCDDDSFYDCLKLEIDYAKETLEDILNRYKNHFTTEELSTLTQDILHDSIFTKTAIWDRQGINFSLDDKGVKRVVASNFYDFFGKIFSFSKRFKE